MRLGRTTATISAGFATLLAALLLLPATGAAEPVETERSIERLYNSRYCEFLMVKQLTPVIEADVFNTVGLGECPPDQFAAATPDANAAGYLAAAKNGPSRWVIDKLLTVPEGDPVDLGGLPTRSIGTLTPPSPVPPPFAEIPFSRSTVWNYRRGRTVRLLISPAGHRYAMLSYSRVTGGTLKESDLNGLGTNPGTALPAGWKFRTKRVKAKSLTLSSTTAGHIVRDGFGNVYQRFNWPMPKNRGIRGLYNSRYCELFFVHRLAPSISVEIFNTVGLNDCPPDAFAAVDLAQVQAEQGALAVTRNGPRRWVLDAILRGEAGQPVDMDGLPMRSVGSIAPPSLSPPPFTEIGIARKTIWRYRQGRTLRIVTSPEGRKYVMQAYSRAPGSKVTERDLDTLGSNPAIMLPDGWTFRTRKVGRKNLDLRADGMATIVRDGLGSVYQRFTWPKPGKPPKK